MLFDWLSAQVPRFLSPGHPADPNPLDRQNSEADSNQFVPIVGFDCRGAEPVDWHPQVMPKP